MSIDATLWSLKFPKTCGDYFGCDWIRVTAQGWQGGGPRDVGDVSRTKRRQVAALQKVRPYLYRAVVWSAATCRRFSPIVAGKIG
jgi:hypothetical protein